MLAARWWWVGTESLIQGQLKSHLCVCLASFEDWGRKVSLRFHLVLSDVDSGNEDFMCKSVRGCKDVGANKFFCFVDLN